MTLQQLAGAAYIVLVPGDASEVHIFRVMVAPQVFVEPRQLVPSLLGLPPGKLGLMLTAPGDGRA